MADAVEDSGPGWEYLLLAHSLADAIDSHESEYTDFVLGYAAPTGQRITDPVELTREASARADETRTAVSNIERLFAPAAIEAALGAPGQSGNPTIIRQLTTRIADVYGSLLAWAAAVRGTEVPSEARSFFDALALLVATPIEEMRAFSTKLVADTEEVIADIRADRPQKKAIVAELRLTIDDGAMDRYEAALKDFELSVTG